MSWYLFFMSLSAGVALLQPTLLSATDELVKSEESSLEATDQLVKPEERPLEPSDQLVKPEEGPLEVTDQLVKPEERPLEPSDQLVKPEKGPLEPTDQLVKPEKGPLEVTDQLVKPEALPLEVAQEAAASPPSGLLKEQEKQEQKEQVIPQPAAPSGFGYTMTNGTGNLIKLINGAFIGAFLFIALLMFFLIIVFKKNTQIRDYLPKFLGIGHVGNLIFATGCSFFLIALVAKLGFYFIKGYAWFKGHPAAFMVVLQLLLSIFFSLLLVLASEDGFFSLKAAMLVIWVPITYFSIALFDLGFSALWQRSCFSSCLLG